MSHAVQSAVDDKLARVWIVDDSALDARNAEKALANTYAVEIFTDGSAALERIADDPPDVLVLDWVMPGISGIEVVQFLRAAIGPLQRVPVLLLTSQHHPEQIVHGLSAGANDYLSKPYASEELRARVESLIRSTRLTERLLETERTLSSLLAMAPDAVLGIDAAGTIVYANAEALKALPHSTVIGERLAELLPVLGLLSLTRRPGDSLVPLPDVAIGDRIYSASARTLVSDAFAAIVLLRDVTERRSSEQRRLDFYSIIAHDLRSPLQAMMMRTHLLSEGRRGPLSDEVLLDLQKFRGSMQSMVRIIDDFLALARLDGSSQLMKPTLIDFTEVVETAMDEMRLLAEGAELELSWFPPKERLHVTGDASRLGQVLGNLIGNAIKFTPRGGRVSVRLTELDGLVEAAVTDTGPGVPAEMVPKLFERFSRDPAQAAKVGSGLGLMIVKEIVEAHGGRVGVRTAPAEGSTFWLQLPKVSRKP
jgi:two-component system phosphate regulon sensor histidine kinase PhoR